ncbi:MAG: hypothetical protein WC319_05245 [Candidatus Paceibacterota bacterium]|jgi:hypothetical protein
MRIVEPGTIRGWANDSTMSNHLLQAAIAEPEIMPQVATLWKSDRTAFSSLLANKGLTSKGLYAGLTNDSYRVVGNRKVMWPVKGITKRKGVIVDYSCRDKTKPGENGEVIAIDTDTDWFSPYDVLELADNRTNVTIVDDQLAKQNDDGSFRLYVRLNAKSKTTFINPDLLAPGMEIGFVMTNFYEMSETGYEKYTFDNWAYSYMTLQRMKWSISGTAAAMTTRKIWIEHNGEFLWTTMAEQQMLERWAEAREYQLLMGQGTVGDNDEVYLKDMKGREIMAGDGLLNMGDGSLKFPYNKLTENVLQNVMSNLQIMSSADGKLEVAVIAGQNFMQQFTKIMGDLGLRTQSDKIIEGDGSAKGINMSYSFYEWNNVRIYPVWHKYFDDPSRPRLITKDGSSAESGRAIFVSLGRADVGSNNVELLTLGNRSFLMGTVAGIDKGGDMKTSVDGSHTHVLSETGIKCANMYGVAEMWKPVRLS